MGEENPSENRIKASRFADENQIPKGNNAKGSVNPPKPRSSWGSNIVKGFSADKKTKLQTKKLPITNPNSDQKSTSVPSHLRAKRSLITDLYCSANATQVNPQSLNTTNRSKSSSGSRDIFLELDNLRSLLQESKDRELKLQSELIECKRNPKLLDLERELELKKAEIDNLVNKVSLLESEKTSLSQQMTSLNSVLERQSDLSKREEDQISHSRPSYNLEMEVLELRRLNMELQLQKRNLACRLSSVESQLASPSKVSESDILENIKKEASLLRHTNEDLSKQVEGLQMSRLNEVEELVYLRWVNSCLRNELRNFSSTASSYQTRSPDIIDRFSNESISLSSCSSDENLEYSGSTKRVSLIKKLKKWPITDKDLQKLECSEIFLDHNWEETWSPRQRHSISGSKLCTEDLMVNTRRQSDGFICSKEVEKETETLVSTKYDWV